MEKLKIRQAVLVEGKYDKRKLASLLDADIFTTNGFSIFSSAEKCSLFKKIANERGLIILTDSDPAGFVIRNKLKGILPKDKVINIYSPALSGKEPRKKQPSKAGILGIEGLDAKTLSDLFEKYGVICSQSGEKSGDFRPYTKADLYALGLCGKTASAQMRKEFCAKHGLPEMTPNALLEAINILKIRI